MILSPVIPLSVKIPIKRTAFFQSQLEKVLIYPMSEIQLFRF